MLFLLGLIILLIGGFFYGKYVEKQFEPDDRNTPAIEKADGVDYVAMSKNKNWLINLLNIAGTGPILGAIQGVLFGPIAFITIPIGCVLAGAVHDFCVGFISMRNDGDQLPQLVKKYLGGGSYRFYIIIISVLLLLTGVVFVYTPGDIIVSDVLKQDSNANAIWIVYAVIFFYYILSTVLPIDALIGRIYPFFGGLLLISAAGVLVGILTKGLGHLSFEGYGLFAAHPAGQRFFPTFFITVACGIISGFHGTQVTITSRTLTSEKEARSTFYTGMITEGLIAMIWAAGALVLFSQGIVPLDTPATLMVGEVSRYFMGDIGGILAVLGVIALPITSGDTAFRSLRLIIADEFNIDQESNAKRASLAAIIFVPAIAILIYAKRNPNGFNILWRYFGFTNVFVATFALGVATVYFINKKKNYLVSLLPGVFYTFVTMTYILNSEIGFSINYTLSLVIAAVITGAYVAFIRKKANDFIENSI